MFTLNGPLYCFFRTRASCERSKIGGSRVEICVSDHEMLIAKVGLKSVVFKWSFKLRVGGQVGSRRACSGAWEDKWAWNGSRVRCSSNLRSYDTLQTVARRVHAAPSNLCCSSHVRICECIVVRMCQCMYLCVHNTYIRMKACGYSSACVCTCIHVSTKIYMCVFTYACKCIHICLRILAVV